MNAPGSDVMVSVAGLWKRFGDTEALRGMDLSVARGTVCGLLGPNGAGKTTAVRILATLVRPDAGRATVAGHDVVREADAVRRSIALAGQFAAVDERLSGRDNLRLFGLLSHLGNRMANRRADELLERFGLSEAAHRKVSTYSGGMRRRLDLITSLIVTPAVLFLDEPTTGLDPASRNEIWTSVREVVCGGTTVLLTTQYLDEADQLASQIVVIDRGVSIASGTPDELKATIGDRLDVVVRNDSDLDRAATALTRNSASVRIEREQRRVSVASDGGARSLITAVHRLEDAGVDVENISMRRPTLDEVFLRLIDRREDGNEPNGAPAGVGVAVEEAR